MLILNVMIWDFFEQINFMTLKNLEIDLNNHSHYHQVPFDTVFTNTHY